MISKERSAYLNVRQTILNLSNISLCRIDYLVQLKRLGLKNQSKAFDCLKSPKVKCQGLTEGGSEWVSECICITTFRIDLYHLVGEEQFTVFILCNSNSRIVFIYVSNVLARTLKNIFFEKEMVTWILTSILPTCPLENIWTMLEELISLSCIACNGYNLKVVDYLWSLLGNSMDWFFRPSLF